MLCLACLVKISESKHVLTDIGHFKHVLTDIGHLCHGTLTDISKLRCLSGVWHGRSMYETTVGTGNGKA